MIPSDVAWVPVVDISTHQGAVNFATMRSRGVLGVILRIAHGMTLDARVASYYPAALAAGYQPDDLGFYSFINPKRGSGPDTARFALDQILKVRGDLDTFYMIDVENYKDESPNAGQAPVFGKEFADYLRAHIKTVNIESPETRVIGYTNRAYWNGRASSSQQWVGDDVLAAEIEWIIARYPAYSHAEYAAKPLPDDPAEWDEWAFKVEPRGPLPPNGADGWEGWQFSAGFNKQGPPYGCSSSDLDLNIVYPEAWRRWTRQSLWPPPVPPPPDPPQEVDVPVKIWTLVAPEGEPVPTEKFIAHTPVTCVWADPHNTRFGHQMDLLRRADPNCDQNVQKANLLFVNLEGLLPTGWDPDDFINGDEIRLRYKTGATPAVDLEARASIATVRQDLESLGADEGALEARFERFLSMLRTSAGGD